MRARLLMRLQLNSYSPISKKLKATLIIISPEISVKKVKRMTIEMIMCNFSPPGLEEESSKAKSKTSIQKSKRTVIVIG